MKTVIGFAGHIGSGKDEACKYLQKNNHFVHYKMAYPIQDIVAIIGGFYSPDYSHRLKFDDREWKQGKILLQNNSGVDMSIRDCLKFIATDLFREQLKQSIWADIFKDYVRTCIYQNVCVSDIRYPEEVEILLNAKHHAGYLVYIDNPIAEENADTSHSSEQYQEFLKKNADYVIINDPTSNSLEDYQQRVFEVALDIYENQRTFSNVNA